MARGIFESGNLDSRIRRFVRETFYREVDYLVRWLSPLAPINVTELFDLYLNPVMDEEGYLEIVVYPIYQMIDVDPGQVWAALTHVFNSEVNGSPIPGTTMTLHYTIINPNAPPLVTGPFYSIDSDAWIEPEEASEFISKTTMAPEKVKVVYDYDNDRVMLGTDAGLAPSGKILGEYDGVSLRLFANELPFNPNYMLKLWAVSFPDKPVEHIYINYAGN